MNTIVKHMRQQLVKQCMHILPPCLLRNTSIAEENDRIISHKGFVEPMENMREDEGQSDNAHVQINEHGGHVEANGCTFENEVNTIREKCETKGEALLTRTIELLILFDMSLMSTGLQRQILCILCDSRDSRLGNGKEMFDIRKLSLGEL